jgi:hypothetical protein
MSNPSPRRRFLAAACCLATLAAVPPSRAADRVDGRGPTQAQARTPGAFTGVSLRIPADVEIRAGATESVTVETSQNLLPLIETAVVHDTLEIRLRDGVAGVRADTLRIVVQAPHIERLAVAGSGTIKADRLRGTELQLQVAGSGSIAAGDIECRAVAASIAGSGDMTLGGAAGKLNASVSGTGRLAAARLKADSVNLSLLGSGTATVSATRELNSSLLGSGTVRYYGDPVLRSSSLGSGSIRQEAGAPP